MIGQQTFNEPIVAVSGISINSSGTVKDSIRSLTECEKRALISRMNYSTKPQVVHNVFPSKTPLPWESVDWYDKCLPDAGDDGRLAATGPNLQKKNLDGTQ